MSTYPDSSPSNIRLSDGEFTEQRSEVMAQHPSGEHVDLEEGIRFNRRTERYISEAFEQAQGDDRVLVGLNVGRTRAENHHDAL